MCNNVITLRDNHQKLKSFICLNVGIQDVLLSWVTKCINNVSVMRVKTIILLLR